MANNGKGIGPNRLGASKGSVTRKHYAENAQAANKSGYKG